MIATRVDPRAWIVWGFALSLVPMLGRNPFPLLATLLVALAVRTGTRQAGDVSWERLLRLALVFGAIGVIFNVLTYHGGDRVLGEVPDWIPIFGGPITLNALVFGLLSGLALITLVAIWSTVAARLEWSDLVRLTPPGLSGIAVSSSIAVTLVPKTIEAFREIREVQAIRGFSMRGPRDLAPLVAPLLTLGLERSVTLAEALESRGFGGPEPSAGTGYRGSALIGATLTSLSVAIFLLATNREIAGMGAFLLSAVLGWVAVRLNARNLAWRPTRYRHISMNDRDRVIIAVSALSTTGLLVLNRLNRPSLFYEPYPSIDSPVVSLSALVMIGLLMVPLVFPQPQDGAP